MNILVTGGAGFIGSNFIRHIIDQPQVDRIVNLDVLTYAGRLENLNGIHNHPKYRFTKRDIRDQRAVHQILSQHHISHVVHLAAESHVDRSISGPADFISTNVMGTFHLLEACRAAWEHQPNNRFLYVSTDEVYGSLGPDGFFTESSPYAPNSPYSASKAAGDFLVRSYHSTYNLPALITHCSNNYGPCQHPEKLIPMVIKNALVNKPIPVYGSGCNVRDWIHVEDHARALWVVLQRGVPGETYNVGADNEWCNLDLVRLVCSLVDSALSRSDTSDKLITLGAQRPGHDFRYAVDSSKIRRELDWSPVVPFQSGLAQTVSHYLEHLHIQTTP